MDEYEYTGNKTKNFFTAYLQKYIRWKRWKYLKTRQRISNSEEPFEEAIQIKNVLTMEELIEIYHKEEILMLEQKGTYPNWDELSDRKLVGSLEKLRKIERLLIYQHVFEEKSFKEIGYLNGLTDKQIKNIYYYAIKKIRKWMGGES